MRIRNYVDTGDLIHINRILSEGADVRIKSTSSGMKIVKENSTVIVRKNTAEIKKQ